MVVVACNPEVGLNNRKVWVQQVLMTRHDL